jgi:alcohol dehydrogenase
MQTMKAAVFVERGRIVLDEKPIPGVGPLDALMRITTTTICGTDVHILKGEYPVRKGLTSATSRSASSKSSAPLWLVSPRASG